MNPIYVNKNKAGGVAGTGASWAEAVLGIDAGIGKIGADTNVVIHVAPGTYNAEPSSRVVLDSRANARTVTIKNSTEADGGGNACPVAAGTCSFLSTASYALWAKSTCASGTILWEGIDISSSSATTAIAVAMNGDVDTFTTSVLTIKDCTLSSTTGTWPLVYAAGIAGVGRTLKLENVTFSATNNWWVYNNSCAKLWITGCSGTCSVYEPLQSPISLGTAAGAILAECLIEDNDFTIEYPGVNHADGTNYYFISGSTLATGVIVMRNNTITSRAKVFALLGTATTTPRLIAYGNTLRLTAGYTELTETPPHIHERDVVGFVVGNPDDTATTYAMGPVIVNNDIEIVPCASGVKSGHSAGIFLGKGCLGGLVLQNKVYGTGCDQAIFLESKYATVLYNHAEGTSGIIFEESDGNKVLFNTCVSTDGDGNHTALAYRDGSINAKQPLNNIAVGNICYGGGTSPNACVWNAHVGSMTVSSNFQDWNMYYLTGTGTGGLFSINTVESDNRSPLALPDWSTFTNGTQYNDEHSEIDDPELTDVNDNDFRLSVGSPAAGSYSATTPIDGASFGAYPANLPTAVGISSNTCPTHLFHDVCTIQKPAHTKDSGGSPILTYSNQLVNIKCLVQPAAPGTDNLEQGRHTGKTWYVVFIEPGQGVKASWRIIWNSKTLHIVSASEPDNKRRFMRIDAYGVD